MSEIGPCSTYTEYNNHGYSRLPYCCAAVPVLGLCRVAPLLTTALLLSCRVAIYRPACLSPSTLSIVQPQCGYTIRCRDRLRHIARVWAAYLAHSRVAAAAAAAAAGDVPFHPVGISFGPATEPGPLDKTGRLPNELLESMFDFLDEDQTMNCACVARRYYCCVKRVFLVSVTSTCYDAVVCNIGGTQKLSCIVC